MNDDNGDGDDDDDSNDVGHGGIPIPPLEWPSHLGPGIADSEWPKSSTPFIFPTQYSW